MTAGVLAVCLARGGVWPALGVGLYFAKCVLDHWRALRAMADASAHGLARLRADVELELAKRSDDAEDLARKLDELGKKVTDLATPERLEAMRNLGRR